MRCSSILVLFLFLYGCNTSIKNNSYTLNTQSQYSSQSTIEEIASDYFQLVRPKFKGDMAYNTSAYVEQFWRVVGNDGFNQSIYHIIEKLEKAGYIEASKAKNRDRLTYQLLKRPLKGKTWEPKAASVTIEGESEPFLQFSSNRNMIYVNSPSTPDKGVSAEVIYVSDSDDLKSIEVNNKIIFAEMSAYKLIGAEVFERGALGILTYDNPAYLQPEKNSTSIQFRHLPTIYADNHWGIALSYKAKEHLKKALASGNTRLTVSIETKRYESEELTVVANIKGSDLPLESLVFSAHVQEPGANDNATGVGAQLEMATVSAELVKNGAINCKRSLTFLWGDEIASTRRYIDEKDDRNPTIKWGISLDMVGENTSITGGSFLIEKMPDPSAIVTRGVDKHTEWGGQVLKESDMFPHYLNDLTQHIFNMQGKHANWTVNNNPFEGGSDHTPFLDAEIPSVLFWHFTDQFYHTDNDRLDKVSQKTLNNVGTASLALAYLLINSDDHTARATLQLLFKAAKERLENEYTLSKTAIRSGTSKEAELNIINNWKEWYMKACETVSNMTTKNSEHLNSEINSMQSLIDTLGNSYLKTLKAL